jgi:hypothetical protein
MTSFFHHLANAALPVALMLLAATVVARVTLELPEATAGWRRAAARHLAPLSTWTLAALAARAVTQALGGGIGGLGLALLLMLAAATMLLRVVPPELAATEEPAPEPVARREPRVPRAPARVPVPEPEPVAGAPLRPADGSLWAGRRAGDDASPGGRGLWQA